MQLLAFMSQTIKNNPSKLEDHLGYWLRCLSSFASDRFAKKLATKDVSVAQWVVMRILYEQKTLLSMRQPNLSVLIKAHYRG